MADTETLDNIDNVTPEPIPTPKKYIARVGIDNDSLGIHLRGKADDYPGDAVPQELFECSPWLEHPDYVILIEE